MSEKNVHNCKFEKEIIGFAKDTASVKTTVDNLDKRLNGAFDTITEHVKDGVGWRRVIVMVVVTIFLQVIAFSYFMGTLTQMVKQNERSILKNTQTLERIFEVKI